MTLEELGERKREYDRLAREWLREADAAGRPNRAVVWYPWEGAYAMTVDPVDLFRISDVPAYS